MVDKAINAVDRVGGWLLYQIDNNNYVEGAVFGMLLFVIPYLLGIIDIVFR